MFNTTMNAEELIEQLKQRIAALTALLERVPHDGNSLMHERLCTANCPRCEFAALRKQWEEARP